MNIEGKKYIYGKQRSIYIDTFKNNYKNIIDDFVNAKKTFDDINNQLDEVNKGTEIYEKNKDSYKNSPNITDKVNNSKKFAEGLKKIISYY